MAYSMIATKPGGPEVLVKNEFEVPAPDTGEILIRQTAIGVNFIDIYFRTKNNAPTDHKPEGRWKDKIGFQVK